MISIRYWIVYFTVNLSFRIRTAMALERDDPLHLTIPFPRSQCSQENTNNNVLNTPVSINCALYVNLHTAWFPFDWCGLILHFTNVCCSTTLGHLTKWIFLSEALEEVRKNVPRWLKAEVNRTANQQSASRLQRRSQVCTCLCLKKKCEKKQNDTVR